MTHPFTLLIPAGISLGAQALLWASLFFFIPFMDRTATLWIACASAAAATIFLVIYRFFAMGMKAWSLSFLACTLIQFASLGSALYFIWLVLRSI